MVIFPTQLENYEYAFYNKAIIPGNMFFRNVEVEFDQAQTFLEKLLTFKPELQNISAETLYEIRNSTSWKKMQMIASDLGMPEELNVTAYLG